MRKQKKQRKRIKKNKEIFKEIAMLFDDKDEFI